MTESKWNVRRPSMAFLVCVFISIIGWLVVTFSKDYRVTMDYQIKCYNLPQNKELVNISDTVLSLTFNQKGLKYLSKPFSSKNKVVYVSVSDLIKPKGKAVVYTVSSREMREYLSHNCFGSELVAVEAPEVITFYLR